MHVDCNYLLHYTFFSVGPNKKASQPTEGKMGNKDAAQSMENLLELGGKDKPAGCTAESKEKPGRHNLLSIKNSIPLIKHCNIVRLIMES